MTHDMARALTDAGYISAAEYLRLCAENGWTTLSKDHLDACG